VVRVAPRPGTSRPELGSDLVGVLDAEVDPDGGAGRVVVGLEREMQLKAVPLADGEAGLLGCGGRSGCGKPNLRCR